MNRLLYITAVVLSIAVLSGCATKKPIDLTPRVELPTWYTNPPLTTDSTLYATGEGQNRDVAIANALNMMASTLSVSVASQYNSKEVVEQGLINSYQSNVSNEIQSDVKKIRISHYELIKSQELGFKKYIVLVTSDKKKLYESLKNELDQKFDLIDKQRESIGKYNALKQLSIYKQAKSEIVDVQNSLIVMNALNSDFDGRDYSESIEAVNSNYDKLLSTITFSIKSDEESKNLVPSLNYGLNMEKLNIQNNSGKTHFRITISSKIQKSSSYGFTLARAAIEIRVKDYKGSVIGSNKLNIIGQSTQGLDVAKESVAIKLNDIIKKDGIGKVLGLDL